MQLGLKPINSVHNFSEIDKDLDSTPDKRSEHESRIFAVFHEQKGLDKATQNLLAMGESGKDIATFTSYQGNFLDHPESLIESKLGEGCLAGIMVGLILGGVLGYFDIFGFEALTGASGIRTIFNMVASAVILGMAFGVVGLIIGRLIPQYNVEQYQTSLPDGYVLMAVKVAPGIEIADLKASVQSAGGVIAARISDFSRMTVLS